MLLAMYSVFVFVFIGYMANILRLVGNKQSGILLGFLVNFALPAQIFNGTYHANVNMDFLLVCLIALFSNLIAGIFILLIGKIFRIERSVLIVLCFLAMLGNTLYLGFPFVQGALGEELANGVMIFDQIVTGIPFAFLAPILLSLNGKTAFSFVEVLKRVFKNPLFLAFVCGALFWLIPFEIPEALFAPLKSLAQTATPVALFAIGVQLNLRGILEWKYPALLLGVKMFIAPLFLFCYVKAFYGEFSGVWKMALIEVAMPPLVSGVAIIYQAGFNAKIALNAVTFGILVSFISIPLWLYFT